MKAPLTYCLLTLLLLQLFCNPLLAQPPGCTLQPPVARIDFGKGEVDDFNQAALYNYDRIYGSCPTDGHYTFTSATYDCFAGDWFTITADHTPGDINGNMMLVNASPSGGIFLKKAITGLKGGGTYEVSMWMINVCRLGICCSSLSPDVSFTLHSIGGRKLASFRIGDLPQRNTAQWRKFAGYFTLPAGENSVVLTMSNSTVGGCGNDFALDDISFSECVPIKPDVAKMPAKKATPTKKTTPKPVAEPVVKLTSAPNRAMAKASPEKLPAPAPTNTTNNLLPQFKPSIPPPPLVRSRSNPLAKEIFTGTAELQIALYDNGQVDGDTVSVYHNNELVISNARLSQAPLRLKVKVDAANPYHELIMVAHNLGSIPPNTSLMVVTAGEQRYQVNISSSEQQNARVVFRWQE
ncbi:hypothetical protein SAMN05444008_1219 [Cnuella takakiae]|uniref:Carbohydrate binding domain-containing protein n=1 Tax=Cnuella takakiae TaxID=1302690 RepID=A0A1M5HZ24_9BACT|nr:hypothetical protein [Cnuella takakiae]OLY91399.1 hypothetical protein BUE76_05400 [Cnuella takakiae]SHG21316.1 hypothetical protein SAMN05444008_1219 [Cnuella takakiae]